MENITQIEEKVRSDVYKFFAEQCEIDEGTLNDDTQIIEDIGGDSLMYLQLMESWKSEYQIDLEFRAIGRYMIKNPVDTLGSAIKLAVQIITQKDKFEEICSN